MNATPTPLPTSTPVPSPTPDAPLAEQLLAKAAQEFTDKKYPEMIGTLLKLKVEIPGYQPERVDGLLWVALRYNGVHLIKETNRLTEGMYYLDLAANYAPLDSEAEAQNRFATEFPGAVSIRILLAEQGYREKLEIIRTGHEHPAVLQRYADCGLRGYPGSDRRCVW